MLAQVSTQLSTRAELTALGGDANDFGFTSPPANFVVPTFNIVCHQKPQGWSAQVQILQRAHEGHNNAYHLGPGTHSTDLMLTAGALSNFVAGPGNRCIHVEVSDAIANDSRDAEQEHCADIRHAYRITLEAVQDALDAARDNGPYSGHAKHERAMRAARLAIGNGLHPRLQAIVNGAVTDNWNVNFMKFRQELGQLYLALCNQSQNRDANGWHFFEPDRTGESWSLNSWGAYFTDGTLDIRKLVRGPAFSVNVTASPAVVFL